MLVSSDQVCSAFSITCSRNTTSDPRQHHVEVALHVAHPIEEKDSYDIPFRQCLIAAHLFHLILTATIMRWVTNLPMGNFCNGQW